MGCGFCATGQAGFDRHLTSGEIVEQVVRGRRAGQAMSTAAWATSCSWAWASRSPTRPPCGPPSSGSTATSACRPATSPISTVGVVPGIRKLAARPLPVNLAVSLHAANDELRDELVPINRRYPIDDADRRVRRLPRRVKGRRLSFEWAMIDGVNDRAERRRRARRAVPPAPPAAHVNLIPLNPTPG